MERAFIGLGSNLGDRVGMLAAALSELAADPRVTLHAVSHAYESEPWGIVDQPAFANAVASLDFAGEPEELLALCKTVERRLGRRRGTRNGPRLIDLDVLLFGEAVVETRTLTLPHPRLRERDFVVTPLLELAPDVATPGGGRVLRREAAAGRVVGKLGPVPGFESLTAGGPAL